MTFIEKYKNQLIQGKMNSSLEDELFTEIKSVSLNYIPKLKANNLSIEEIKELKLYSKLLRDLIYFRVLKESNHIEIKKEIEDLISEYLSLPLEIVINPSESKITVTGSKTSVTFNLVNSFYALYSLTQSQKELDLFLTFLVFTSDVEAVISILKAFFVKKYLESNKI